MDTREAHLSASSRLIATRVPADLGPLLVEAAAAEELISVASYARVGAITQAVSTRELQMAPDELYQPLSISDRKLLRRERAANRVVERVQVKLEEGAGVDKSELTNEEAASQRPVRQPDRKVHRRICPLDLFWLPHSPECLSAFVVRGRLQPQLDYP